MNERNIEILPYIKIDNLIDIGGYLKVDDVNEQIDLPNDKRLILYNYSLLNGILLLPRNHEKIDLVLSPTWSKNYHPEDILHLILPGEAPGFVLKLRINVWCKNTRWCSKQVAIDINELNGKSSVRFEIPLSEVKEEIVISGYLTREINNGKNANRKANAALSIVSSCEDISIQIDERKDIGSNHLPIFPENIGDLVFDVHGLDKDFDLPVIKYSEEFKDFFVRDDLNTVNTVFLMSMFYFFDTYLKWLIFTCRYDSHEKNHKGLVESISKYCSVSKNRLIEIIELEKYCQEQIKEYLILSPKLMNGLQVNSPIKYSKILKQMIKEEIK